MPNHHKIIIANLILLMLILCVGSAGADAATAPIANMEAILTGAKSGAILSGAGRGASAPIANMDAILTDAEAAAVAPIAEERLGVMMVDGAAYGWDYDASTGVCTVVLDKEQTLWEQVVLAGGGYAWVYYAFEAPADAVWYVSMNIEDGWTGENIEDCLSEQLEQGRIRPVFETEDGVRSTDVEQFYCAHGGRSSTVFMDAGKRTAAVRWYDGNGRVLGTEKVLFDVYIYPDRNGVLLSRNLSVPMKDITVNAEGLIGVTSANRQDALAFYQLDWTDVAALNDGRGYLATDVAAPEGACSCDILNITGECENAGTQQVLDGRVSIHTPFTFDYYDDATGDSTLYTEQIIDAQVSAFLLIWYDADGQPIDLRLLGVNIIPYSGSTPRVGYLNNGSSKLRWQVYRSGLLSITGAGAMAQYADDQSFEWKDSVRHVDRVYIGPRVTYVSPNAFRDFVNLKKFEVDEDNPYFIVYDGALYDRATMELLCVPRGRTEIELAPDITGFDSRAFRDCVNLMTFGVDEDNPYFIVYDGALYDRATMELLCVPRGRTEIELAPDVTGIGSRAFRQCGKITEIALPEGVRYIGESAFEDCDALAKIDLSGSVTSIKRRAFAGCDALTHLVLPENIQFLGDHAFAECARLQSVALNADIHGMGDSVFRDCPVLDSVTVRDGVKILGECIFWGCGSLKSIVIPESMRLIGSGAFLTCGRHFVIYGTEGSYAQEYAANNRVLFAPVGTEVTIVDGGECGAEGGNVIWEITVNDDLIIRGEGDMAAYTTAPPWWYSYRKYLNSARVESGVTGISPWAFSQLSKLRSVYLADGIKSIGENAFSSNPEITEILIPDSVEVIGGFAFMNCPSLTDVHLPDRLTKVEKVLFEGCTALKRVEIPEGVTEIGALAFCYCKSLEQVVIPRSVSYISTDAFIYCGNVTIFAPTGSYAQEYAESHGIPFVPNQPETQLILPAALTEIGDEAFMGNAAIECVIVPESVTRIGCRAFADCADLKQVYLPETLTDIAADAFDGCNEDIRFIRKQME